MDRSKDHQTAYQILLARLKQMNYINRMLMCLYLDSVAMEDISEIVGISIEAIAARISKGCRHLLSQSSIASTASIDEP
ncbi:hypothetical protein [Pseudochryseolinea flava]|nr:hypothetical protein [Pseudochryseolinea flava]